MKKWRAFLAAIARDRDHRFRVVGGEHVIPIPELPDDFDPPSVSLRPRYVESSAPRRRSERALGEGRPMTVIRDMQVRVVEAAILAWRDDSEKRMTSREAAEGIVDWMRTAFPSAVEPAYGLDLCRKDDEG